MISASSSRAVATMTGAVVTVRIIFSAWPPSRSGRPRSRTISSGGCWLTSLMPSSAVPAVRTACDRRVRSATIAERTYESSSTMSTRAITRTVRIEGVACGIIADMVRLVVGLTAWMAGTAIAVSVAWLGANVVVRNAGVGPGMPVISASVLPPASASPAAPTPAGRRSLRARERRADNAGREAGSVAGPPAAAAPVAVRQRVRRTVRPRAIFTPTR